MAIIMTNMNDIILTKLIAENWEYYNIKEVWLRKKHEQSDDQDRKWQTAL